CSSLPTSAQRMVLGIGVAPGDVVFELALDVAEQRGGANAEQVGLEPAVAKLLLHQGEPGERVLGSAQAAGRLEADGVASELAIVAQRAEHGERDGQRGVFRFLA